jgi:hypothetical protein
MDGKEKEIKIKPTHYDRNKMVKVGIINFFKKDKKRFLLKYFKNDH